MSTFNFGNSEIVILNCTIFGGAYTYISRTAFSGSINSSNEATISGI